MGQGRRRRSDIVRPSVEHEAESHHRRRDVLRPELHQQQAGYVLHEEVQRDERIFERRHARIHDERLRRRGGRKDPGLRLQEQLQLFFWNWKQSYLLMTLRNFG